MSVDLHDVLKELIDKTPAHNAEFMRHFCAAVQNDHRFKNLNPDMVAREMHEIVDSSAAGSTIHFKPALDGLYDMISKDPEGIVASKPWGERIANNWSKLETVHKVDASIWGVGALYGAFGVLHAAKNSVARDDEGNTHLQWSQVGVALLQATLGAGCAYMTARALNGGALR